MQHDSFHQTDLYRIRLGSNRIERLTDTAYWSENRPTITGNGDLLFVSDQNGIPNTYEYDLANRSSHPLTNLQSRVIQISLSLDGTRLTLNALSQLAPGTCSIRTPLPLR